MITWIFGNTTSGKTTLARCIINSEPVYPYANTVWLDGDSMRNIWKDLGLSKEDRWEQNLRVARLAKMIDEQGFNVVVSVICPYKKLRAEIKKITNCKFIYIEGGKDGKEYPFESTLLY